MAGASEVIGMGGTLRRLNRSFVGLAAVQTVEAHCADHLFFSVKAIAATGMLTEADPREAEVKADDDRPGRRGDAARRPVELSARGLTAIAPVSELACVLAADLTPPEVSTLRAHGVQVRTVASGSSAGAPTARAEAAS